MPTSTDADRERWNRLVLSSAYPSFMQSWEWGEVQSQFGLQIECVLGADGQALVVQRPLPFSRSWLYVPRGPIVNKPISKTQDPAILEHLAKLGREGRSVFVRVDPAIPVDAPDAAAWRDMLAAAGYQAVRRQVQPQHTRIVDVALSDADLLADMHAKTRYNIRLAERKGVTVRFSTAREDVEHFLRLSGDVRERGGFHYHPAAYYRAMIDVLGSSAAPETATAELAIAEHQGTVLAVHILVYFGDTATYVHGASSSHLRSFMAPHLLQWASLQHARERGARFYDLFGVAPPLAQPFPKLRPASKASTDAKALVDMSAGTPPHPWAGITRFKEGFGGRRVSYIGAHDLVLEPVLYTALAVARRLRRLL